jgi:hypothetical protein
MENIKINKNLRILAVKRIIKRCEILQSKVNPYGYDSDKSMEYYYLIDYWEDRLYELKNK